MNVTLPFIQPDDWKILLPLLERLKIPFKIDRQNPSPTPNALQLFLLTGPVASADDLQAIEAKKQQFNQWK